MEYRRFGSAGWWVHQPLWTYWLNHGTGERRSYVTGRLLA